MLRLGRSGARSRSWRQLNEKEVPSRVYGVWAARRDHRQQPHDRSQHESEATRHQVRTDEGGKMTENAEYNLGYFEGVRAAFLIWNQNLVRYESDGVVELQLNSEKFFTELEVELKTALALRDEK